MTPTTITCLGHGGAFADSTVGNTAYLVDHGQHRILVDCGGTVPHVLKEFGVDPASLTVILITHLHGDHVNGLEQILYHRHYVNKVPPLDLVMGPVTGVDWMHCVGSVRNDLQRHVRLHATTGMAGRYCAWRYELGADVDAAAFRVSHGGDVPDMACYSFELRLGDTTLFFSGDRIWCHTSDAPVFEAMRRADLVFHEIEMFWPASNAHTNIQDVTGDHAGDKYWWGHHGVPAGGPRYSNAMLRESPELQLAYKGDVWIVDGNGPRLVEDSGVRVTYPGGVCPDCRLKIPSNACEGSACARCGHVFYHATSGEGVDHG